MSCNCNNGISLCSRCSVGLTCSCPPDYSVLPLPVDCGCCPPGYTFQGPTANYPNGFCTNSVGTVVPVIPCTQCVESVPADCVILPEIACLGVQRGTTLTAFLANILCSEAYVLNLINKIGVSTTLKAAMCNVISTCPIPSSLAPVAGPLVGSP